MRLSKMDQKCSSPPRQSANDFLCLEKRKRPGSSSGDVWAENRAENKIFYSLSAPSFVARDVSMERSFVSKSPHLIHGRLTLESGGLSGSRFLNPLGFLRLFKDVFKSRWGPSALYEQLTCRTRLRAVMLWRGGGG